MGEIAMCVIQTVSVRQKHARPDKKRNMLFNYIYGQ